MKNLIFSKIEIRKIGIFIAMNNLEKSRDRQSSSKNPVVSDDLRSDNRDLTVYDILSGYSSIKRVDFIKADFSVGHSDIQQG